MTSPIPPNLVIYNPIAGNGRAQEHWPKVESALRKAGVHFNVAATNAPLEAREFAQQAPQKYSRIIAIGGDGTINEIVNGLMRASEERETIPLGIVPLGNGDDFAKMIPPETVTILVECTEGWAVGLRLACLALRDQDDCTGFLETFHTHHFIKEYLVDEILSRQSQPVQNLLLCTSILDRFCASLGDVLLEAMPTF